MSQNAGSACLYTTVKNVSGVTKFFGFLGARGMRLAANESVTIPGNLIESLGGRTSQRKFQALENALDRDSTLKIISTPSVHLYDAVEERTRTLAIQSGLLGLVDPCWDSSGSSNFAVGASDDIGSL